MANWNFLEVARSIGRRICRQASWQGERCTWQVERPHRTPQGEWSSVLEAADGALYQGTAGIVWFLLELFRQTGDEEARRCAEGGLREALAQAASSPETAFGFHSGRVGVALVASRAGKILQRKSFREAAGAVLEPLQGKASQDSGLDVVDGAAGAIPPLLILAEDLGRPELTELAIALGDRSLATARREPGGWCWPTAGGSDLRGLCGLAHGASGFALALLELAAATGEGRFRFAAEMAFAYERQFFDPDTGNWPDLRHAFLAEHLEAGRLEELRRAAREGALPAYSKTFMTAWCHGAPGIGLARLRAFEVTGQELYLEEAKAALATTLKAVRRGLRGGGNFSLCHGLGGNCELLLTAGSLGLEKEVEEGLGLCREVARYGAETYGKDGRPWPGGHRGDRSDCSLMLGDAGIGLFYLRLADPSSPTPLLCRPPAEPPPASEAAPDLNAGFEAAARQSVGESFAGTLSRFEALTGFELPAGAFQLCPRPLLQTPVEAAFAALEERVETASGSLREWLEDAFEEERQQYLSERSLEDLTAELVAGWTRPPLEEIDWEAALFQAHGAVRLVRTLWDWPAFLDAVPKAEPRLREGPELALLYRRGNRIVSRPIGPLAAVVVEALETPGTLAGLVARLVADGPLGDEERRRLSAKAREQICRLYEAGVAELCREAGP